MQCKQGPEQPFLEHSAAFHHLRNQLQDLGDALAKDERYLYAIFKRSLNSTFSEILCPLEVVKGGMSYEEAQMELIRLEVGGKVYATIPTVQLAGAPAVGMVSDAARSGGWSGSRPAGGNALARGCAKCGKNNHATDKCLNHIVCHKCDKRGRALPARLQETGDATEERCPSAWVL